MTTLIWREKVIAFNLTYLANSFTILAELCQFSMLNWKVYFDFNEVLCKIVCKVIQKGKQPNIG